MAVSDDERRSATVYMPGAPLREPLPGAQGKGRSEHDSSRTPKTRATSLVVPERAGSGNLVLGIVDLRWGLWARRRRSPTLADLLEESGREPRAQLGLPIAVFVIVVAARGEPSTPARYQTAS
jgi:hypothetical protein